MWAPIPPSLPPLPPWRETCGRRFNRLPLSCLRSPHDSGDHRNGNTTWTDAECVPEVQPPGAGATDTPND